MIVLASCNPSTGATGGGTSLTILGSDFVNGLTVTIGGTAATVSMVTSSMIMCTTPGHASGTVDIVVTNPDATFSTLTGSFTFSNPAPTLMMLSASSGPTAGGTALTLTGTGFGSSAIVTIGGTAATGVTVNSSTSISCTSPSHSAGMVDVVVMNTDMQTATLPAAFTYSDPTPTLSSVSPASGSSNGGDAVVINGTNFGTGAMVSFGGNSATGVTVNSSTSISCTTPAHSSGMFDVVVMNPGNQQGTLPMGFTFV